METHPHHNGIYGMIILRVNMQGEDIIEHTNAKCHVLTFQFASGRYS
jgi:hypothetical protein